MICPDCKGEVLQAGPKYGPIREGLATRIAMQEARFSCTGCNLHWNTYGEAMRGTPHLSQINDGSIVQYVSQPEFNVSPQVLP